MLGVNEPLHTPHLARKEKNNLTALSFILFHSILNQLLVRTCLSFCPPKVSAVLSSVGVPFIRAPVISSDSVSVPCIGHVGCIPQIKG